MKKMKKGILLLITGAILFSACKKDKTEEPVVKTVAQKVVAKWNAINFVENDFYNNTPHITTTPAVAGDYADFRTDGKVYSQFLGMKDTVAYSIVNDNTIKIDGDNYEIKTLTDNQFILYNKFINSTTPLEFTESTLNFNK
jgi:hypothetical protein